MRRHRLDRLIAGVVTALLIQAAFGQPCYLSVQVAQLSRLDNRLDERVTNLISMSESLMSADRTWLDGDTGLIAINSLGYLSLAIQGLQDILFIRDSMQDERDKRFVNRVTDAALRRLSKTADGSLKDLNKVLPRLRSPAIVAEVTAARDVITEITSALRACPSLPPSKK